MAEAATAEAAEAPKKGSSKLLIIVGAVVLLAGGGGAAWWFGFRSSGEHAEAKQGEAHGEGAEGATAGEDEHAAASLEALDPFIVNLSDEDGKRYLKATLQVELFDPKGAELLKSRQALTRDLLLTLFASKTFGEVRTPQGKAQLREEIVNRLNRAMNKDVVKAVYFTEFIIQ